MHLRTVLAAVIAIVLGAGLGTGCAGNRGADDTYIGWHCTGDMRKDDWQCHKRRMRNGIPVDDVIYEVRSAGDSQQAVVPETDDNSMVLLPPRNGDWKKQLPALDSGESVAAANTDQQPAPAADSSSDENGAAPEAEPAFDSWAESEEEDTGETATGEFNGSGLPPMADTSAIDSERKARYTVQLGAFANFRGIREFIRENNLESLALERHRIASNGRIWHVITFGAFADRESAENAWAEYAVERPEVKIWVRTIKSLLEARAIAEE